MVRWAIIDRAACKDSPWREWCLRHGIHPNDVALDTIECDDTARTVGYFKYNKTCDKRIWVVHQLEARALPFPNNKEYATGTASEGYQVGEWYSVL